MGLDDQQLADVLTYVRSAFGNQAPAVKMEDVKAVRESTKGRTASMDRVRVGEVMSWLNRCSVEQLARRYKHKA